MIVQRIRSFRKDVVPGSLYYDLANYGRKIRRHPQTMQERRRFQADEDLFLEFRLKLRRRRAPIHLRTGWSDVNRSDCRSRGWKDLSKCSHQYEVKVWNLKK